MSALIRPTTLAILRNVQRSFRMISTSQKKSDTAVAQPTNKTEDIIDFSIDAVKKSKHWVSYGFDYEDKDYDRQIMRSTMFFSITIAIVLIGFVLAYIPEPHQKDWALREAFIQLRERELAGLPPIDANIVDPSLVQLPSEEELGDTEIII